MKFHYQDPVYWLGRHRMCSTSAKTSTRSVTHARPVWPCEAVPLRLNVLAVPFGALTTWMYPSVASCGDLNLCRQRYARCNGTIQGVPAPNPLSNRAHGFIATTQTWRHKPLGNSCCCFVDSHPARFTTGGFAREKSGAGQPVGMMAQNPTGPPGGRQTIATVLDD